MQASSSCGRRQCAALGFARARIAQRAGVWTQMLMEVTGQQRRGEEAGNLGSEATAQFSSFNTKQSIASSDRVAITRHLDIQ